MNANERLEVSGARTLSQLGGSVFLLLTLLHPAGAHATHKPLDLVERCQLAVGKSLSTYDRDRIRCTSTC